MSLSGDWGTIIERQATSSIYRHLYRKLLSAAIVIVISEDHNSSRLYVAAISYGLRIDLGGMKVQFHASNTIK